jgi:hypothetical protein
MKPELLASAYFLQRLHGAAFAAGLLEEHGMSRVKALRLLADRPGEIQSSAALNPSHRCNQLAKSTNKK